MALRILPNLTSAGCHVRPLACLIHQSWDSREKDGKRGSMGGGLVLGGSYVGEDGFEDVSRGRI